MKKQYLLYLFLFFLLIPASSEAQIFSKKKKDVKNHELEAEIKLLRRTVDSLQEIINDGSIALYDTTSLNDSINVGEFNFEDWPDAMDIEPGSNPDSLLAIWYQYRNTACETPADLNLDSINFTTNIPDSVYITKIKRMNSIIPIPYNNIVRNSIIYYTERKPAFSSRLLGLSAYYLPIFEEIMDYYGLPKELKAMAIIESALNPFAVSPTRAKGIWQFMYRTALQYGLTINSYVDERLDPYASAEAAAKYLRDSYTIFGDWSLAIASYNCGSGNVLKAIRRAGGAKDFWSIYPYLPRETRNYIPSFVGALYLLNYYKDYQINPVKYNLPPHVDTISINKNVHFEQIAQNIGISVGELRELNPQYIHNIVPGNEKEYILKLPYNFTAAFIDKENDIYTYKDSVYLSPIVYKPSASSGGRQSSSSSYITHKVRKGENLGRISEKYGVTIAQVKKWNNLRSSNIQIGKRLKIYRNGGGSTNLDNIKDENIPDNVSAVSHKSHSSKSKGYTYYTIRRGDTLLGIANKFPGVSLDDILKLNGLSKRSKIFPGKKLKIKRG